MDENKETSGRYPWGEDPEKQKMELATGLLLGIIKRMVKAEFNGPEAIIWTDDNKMFHVIGHAVKKEEKSDS